MAGSHTWAPKLFIPHPNASKGEIITCSTVAHSDSSALCQPVLLLDDNVAILSVTKIFDLCLSYLTCAASSHRASGHILFHLFFPTLMPSALALLLGLMSVLHVQDATLP